MYCTKCGKELVGAGVFCQSCGSRQEVSESEFSQGRQPIKQQQQTNYTSTDNRKTDYFPQRGDYNSHEALNRSVKFPIASICFILLALLMLWITFVDQFIYLNITMLVICIFILVVLLLKKHGNVLTIAVCALTIPFLISVVDNLITNIKYGSSIDWYNLLISIPYGYSLLLVLAIYCNKIKESYKTRVLPKLWFIPGIINVFVYVMQDSYFIDTYNYIAQHPSSSKSFFTFIISHLMLEYSNMPYLLFRMLHCVAVFLLGYWIFYIYSVKNNSASKEG